MAAKQVKKKHEKQRLATVIVTTVTFALAGVNVALEAIAGVALNWCHQHPYINFYWAVWGLLQVGTLLAICGVTVHHWASLKDKDLPPWNVALGTPVLIVAAMCHALESQCIKLWRRLRKSPVEDEIE